MGALKRLVAASAAIFLTGMAISGAVYFSARPVRFQDSVLSNFLSPGDNPRGYTAAAVGTVMAGLVLAPTALIFHRRLSAIHRWWSIAAAVFYGLGVLAAILIGLLAPVPGLDFSVHLMLAYAAFMSLQAGISVYLTIAAYGAKSRRLFVFTAVEWILTVVVLALSFGFGPDWPANTAFYEWALCATIGAGLWVLTSWYS
jgi:hypothetical protein